MKDNKVNNGDIMKIVSNKPTITRKELENVLDCLIKDELITGSSVKSFESAISDTVGLKYSLAVNSLTSAYILVFKALELQSDDEVIMPAFYSQSGLSALQLTSGIPVLVDSDSNSIFPTLDQIKEKITDKTKAIVIADTFGYHFDANEILELNIPVIADISHSIGSEYNETPAGSYAAFTVASFAPSMILTTGNGGIILTNNSKSFSAMRDLRGHRDNTINFDFCMTDLQGSMGISQFMKLKEFLKRRREIAKKYHESLRMTPHKPVVLYGDSYSYQTFPVIFDTPAERVEKYWKKHGIEIQRALPTPNHILMGLKGFDYPNADRLSKKLYTLPLYPTLSKKEIEKVSKTLAAFI